MCVGGVCVVPWRRAHAQIKSGINRATKRGREALPPRAWDQRRRGGGPPIGGLSRAAHQRDDGDPRLLWTIDLDAVYDVARMTRVETQD